MIGEVKARVIASNPQTERQYCHFHEKWMYCDWGEMGSEVSQAGGTTAKKQKTSFVILDRYFRRDPHTNDWKSCRNK